jgi:Zn-dependent alcohol dehydrogenase
MACGGHITSATTSRHRLAQIVIACVLAGAGMIVACDLLDSKLGYAKEFGATHTFNGKQDNIVERVRELTQGRGVDYAFDAIGGEPGQDRRLLSGF